MRKLPVIIFFLVLSLANICNAQLTAANISTLKSKLMEILAPCQNKVGVTFIDLNTGLKLSINGKNKFPAASVAKVPVMAAAYHLADNNKIDLNQKLLFTENDKLPGSGVLQWMKGGREYTVWNLVRLMIVLSDNTATRLVINKIGTPEINSYLLSQGILGTYIIDNTCLNEKPSPAINYTTPDDMAMLLVMINSPGKFLSDSKKDMISFMKRQRYRWGIWRGVPGGIQVADKTGNVEGVLNDAGIVYAKQGPYVLSIFTNGFKKQRDARLAINKISEAVYQTVDAGYAPAYKRSTVPKLQKQKKKAKAKGNSVRRNYRHRTKVKSVHYPQNKPQGKHKVHRKR